MPTEVWGGGGGVGSQGGMAAHVEGGRGAAKGAGGLGHKGTRLGVGGEGQLRARVGGGAGWAKGTGAAEGRGGGGGE